MYFRRRLLQPVPHLHFAVHRDCGIEVLQGFPATARAATEFPESKMTVGDEWLHPELAGMSKSATRCCAAMTGSHPSKICALAATP
jgi:hypothetical protein